MTLAISDYPRKRLGKVAEVNGMTTTDGPWIAVREAFDITGLKPGVLARWGEEGLLSVLRTAERTQRLYLKPELELLVGLGTCAPPTLRSVRRYLRTHEGARLVTALAGLLSGQGFMVEMVDELCLRVAKGTGPGAVEIEGRRRGDDGDRWWFGWVGGSWMCEADKPADAGVQVKAALREVMVA
ncbi:hypothetical protein [Actinomadura rugatobispora]|uniref:MerR family transcriptional regulator n=1 Tax=Actinomadura rugatobispora TaxID=1994 RepID=A0ABW1A6E4_9ACTN